MCSAGARPRKTGRSWSSKWVRVPLWEGQWGPPPWRGASGSPWTPAPAGWTLAGPWEGPSFPWALTARNTNGPPCFSALGWADAPGNGWRGFLSLPSGQLKPPLGAPHASPQLPLSRQYPGPLLGYPFDRDVHSRRSRLFEWALGWGCGFCVAAGWRLFTEPRLRDHMLCRERGEIKKALSIAVSARQRGIRGSSPPVVEAATTCPGPLSRLWIPPPAPSFHEAPLEQVLPGRLGHQE